MTRRPRGSVELAIIELLRASPWLTRHETQKRLPQYDYHLGQQFRRMLKRGTLRRRVGDRRLNCYEWAVTP